MCFMSHFNLVLIFLVFDVLVYAPLDFYQCYFRSVNGNEGDFLYETHLVFLELSLFFQL